MVKQISILERIKGRRAIIGFPDITLSAKITDLDNAFVSLNEAYKLILYYSSRDNFARWLRNLKSNNSFDNLLLATLLNPTKENVRAHYEGVIAKIRQGKSTAELREMDKYQDSFDISFLLDANHCSGSKRYISIEPQLSVTRRIEDIQELYFGEK